MRDTCSNDSGVGTAVPIAISRVSWQHTFGVDVITLGENFAVAILFLSPVFLSISSTFVLVPFSPLDFSHTPLAVQPDGLIFEQLWEVLAVKYTVPSVALEASSVDFATIAISGVGLRKSLKDKKIM